ncbi:hypothetical protein SteCoe_10140 [Stentor coeruleus]|uniref:Uncharacterized protein n=1 Tax=Stentor coeruleus TaxID=5963 RepID=A0A1R2CG41_9CILI|nr:hypothetical protein SteCoe_10140 [Stentor coeruleus]
MDEQDYYRNFVNHTLNDNVEIPSDDEEYFAPDEAAEDNFEARVPKSELADLVYESGRNLMPPPTVYRPVIPMYNPRTISQDMYITREQRILLLSQIEYFVQILLHSFFLSEDIKTKEEYYRILKDLLKKTEGNSREYDVSFIINFKAKVVIPKQTSVLHIPMVDIIKNCMHIDDFLKVIFTRRELRETLMVYSPAFISKTLLPLENPPSPRKIKQGFTVIDDMLLLQGLSKTKSSILIQEQWLKKKTSLKIKNRIKNLKSKKYIPKNEAQERIMKFLEDQRKNFTEEEIQQLRRGLQWFEIQRIPQIQKYFLPHRTIKQITELSQSQTYDPPSTFALENLDDIEACNCFCQCEDAFEIYIL